MIPLYDGRRTESPRPRIFKKALAISLLGHLTFLGVFSFSFGPGIPSSGYADVFFLGQFLRHSDLAVAVCAAQAGAMINPKAFLNDKAGREYSFYAPDCLRPEIPPAPLSARKIFIQQPETKPAPAAGKGKEAVVMFYPPLPRHFLLYFKDRQEVHIELMFNVTVSGGIDSIAVRRKVSSGNLEADLLAMRYIKHYLFIQKGYFPGGDWQTVKIDLGPKE